MTVTDDSIEPNDSQLETDVDSVHNDLRTVTDPTDVNDPSSEIDDMSKYMGIKDRYGDKFNLHLMADKSLDKILWYSEGIQLYNLALWTFTIPAHTVKEILSAKD